MALNPGSYARAAGLQSEVNKVTITRVAGSEVRFRRTIDTYQRDLRYSVNQIGREQKQLKRSMRRYYNKLRQSRRERREREAKAKEDAERLQQQAQHFRQAERAVRRNVLTLTQPETSSPSKANEDGAEEQETVPDPASGDAARESALPESSRSGEVQELSGSGGPHEGCPPIEKPPYLQRGVKGQAGAALQQHEPTGRDAAAALTEAERADPPLPVIKEEGEEGADRGKPRPSLQPAAGRRGGPSGHSPTEARSLGHPPAAPPGAAPRLPLVSQALSGTRDVQPGADITARGQGTAAASAEPSHHSNGAVTLPSGVAAGGRLRRRKGGVSYGDLVKLQHGSSTKRLFTLVDRLASRHGIAEPPASRASKASSLDPRANARIKRRGEWPESQMSDEMVRQAAVLYSIKYGYHVTDDGPSDDVTLPLFLPLQISGQPTVGNDGEDVSIDTDVTERDRVDSYRSNRTSRITSTSVRRDSIDVTSPYYTFSEAGSSLFFDEIFTNGLPDSLDIHVRRGSRSKIRQPLSMSQLSEQATKVRERSILAADSQSLSVTTDSNTPRPPSSPPLHSHSKSRARRDSVSNQLQRRLQEQTPGAAMAWHSAFGRLKLLHTLYDLSQHFNKDGD